MLTDWLINNVPHLIGLAAHPFNLKTHERYFASIDWTIYREGWYPETCLEIRFSEVGRRLIAVYEKTESGLGIGLYALTGRSGLDDYYIAADVEFHSAFYSTLNIIGSLFPVPPTIGRYGSIGSADCNYNYACWSFPTTFMTLVQHCEGDGQCGHFASLDIRMVPRRGADRLAFPLTTNILF